MEPITQSNQIPGSKYILWMLVVTIGGLLLFSAVNASLFKKYTVRFTEIYQKSLPQYMEEGNTFKTGEILLSQLFIPGRNTKITVVIPAAQENQQPVTPGVSLFDETKLFQLTKNPSASVNPLFIKYLSSLFDFKRGARYDAKTTSSGKQIEFFQFKDTQYYAAGIFELNGKTALVTAFCPGAAVDYDVFAEALKDLGFS